MTELLPALASALLVTLMVAPGYHTWRETGYRSLGEL